MSRTLFITNDFPPRRGGIETWVRAMCDDLPPEQVVVYTASMPGDAEYDAELPFQVYRDPSSTLLPSRRVARRAADVMRSEQCARIVFGAAAPLGLLGPSLRRAGAEHIRAVTHGHEAWWAILPVTRRLLRRIADAADEITCVSEWAGRRIAPALSEEARRRLRLLQPTVDTSRFRPGAGGAEVRQRLDIATEALVVVCVARLVRRKGQDTLIRLLPTLQQSFPRVRLLLVGDGPARRRLERLAARHRVAEDVIFAGSVPWSDVPAYLDAGDVFAMPSRTRRCGLEAEAFGIVYLEAAAMGLPLVGGHSGGATEAVATARATNMRKVGAPDSAHALCPGTLDAAWEG